MTSLEQQLQPIILHDIWADDALESLREIIRTYNSYDDFSRVVEAIGHHVWFMITAHEFNEMAIWSEVIDKLRLEMKLRIVKLWTYKDLIDHGITTYRENS